MLTADGEAAELIPARFNERLIAYVLDGAPFMAGYALTLLYAPQPVQRLLGEARGAALAWIALYVLYHFAGNLSGATIGKRLMGLRVVRRDGEPLGLTRSFMRAVGHLISTPLFNFGFVLALVHPHNRALHDLLAGSVVVEPERKPPAEAAVLFIAAVLTLSGLYGLVFYLNLYRPTPADLAVVEKARDGLRILADIQEARKQTKGAYTDSLGELAAASGDPEQFRAAMKELFRPDRFELRAGNRGYRITAEARDRFRTRVTIEGPPPTLR